MSKRNCFVLKPAAAVIVLLSAMAVSCCIGSSGTGASELWKYITGQGGELPDTVNMILGRIRIPRVITAALVGGNLALIGSVMQGLLKNPMADPSILGISSGSALGAAVAMAFGSSGALFGGSITGTYVGAIIGAIVTWLLVFFFAHIAGGYDSASTILAGVAVSSVMTGLITFLMTIRRENLERIYMWMLGSLTFSTPERMRILLAVTAIAGSLIVAFSKRIDVLRLGRETAHTLGVNSGITLGILMLFSSVLLAFCVATSGIIGFVGLIIPHIVSFFRINRARQRAVMSFVTGAAFLVICDTIAKSAAAPGEIAVGAVTSLVGGPYFLFLLCRNRIRSLGGNR